MVPLTALDVQGMVLVQAPAPQLGGVDFIALQHCRPFLPQDQIWAGFIFVTHGNCRDTRGKDTSEQSLRPGPQADRQARPQIVFHGRGKRRTML